MNGKKINFNSEGAPPETPKTKRPRVTADELEKLINTQPENEEATPLDTANDEEPLLEPWTEEDEEAAPPSKKEKEEPLLEPWTEKDEEDENIRLPDEEITDPILLEALTVKEKNKAPNLGEIYKKL